MGEVIRELETPVDGHFMVRIYAARSNDRWHAWLESISLEHGNLSRSAVIRTFPDREAVSEWAKRPDVDELRRALEDAELASAGELGRTPV